MFRSIYSKYPVLTLSTIYLVFPLLVAVIWLNVYWSGSVISDDLSIIRDGQKIDIRVGNPLTSISASSDSGAYYALGYAHAADRLWQMEMTRRMAAGRLSEVVGSSGLMLDKLMRTIGLHPLSINTLEYLPEQVKIELSAYIQGVNDSINRLDVLPVEFLYYGIKPELWTEVDSISIYALMAWMMSRNYSDEIFRDKLISLFGIEKASDFMLAIEDRYRPLLAYSERQQHVVDGYEVAEKWFDPFVKFKGIVGSNNWVISGRLSHSGSPLLASDPHLNLSSPSSWYVAHLQGSNLNFKGATFPGFPFFIMGRNKNIAWGITNMGADVQDIRIEKISSDGTSTYEKDGRFLPLIVRNEEIIIRPDALKSDIDPVRISIRNTENGPLLSDVIGGISGSDFSVSWVGYHGLSGSVSALARMASTSDWPQFKEALRDFEVPSQNFVFADEKGNIAYHSAGKIPIRNSGIGATPKPGWTSEYDWTGWIDFDELPNEFNPESGFIATANNNVLPENYPHLVTVDWAPPYRKDRISEVIMAKSSLGSKLNLKDMKALQLDTVSLAAQKLLPSLLVNLTDLPDQYDDYTALLSDWDGDMSRDSAAAALFQVWVKALHRIILSDEKDSRAISSSDAYYLELLLQNPDYNFLLKILAGDEFSWCDDKNTSLVNETCSKVVVESFLFSVNDLHDRLGDLDDWEWGDLHRTQYSHVPFSRCEFSPFYPCGENRYFHSIFHFSAAAGGDEYTVDVAPASGINGIAKYQQFWGASYRQVFDLSDTNCSEFYLAPGRSGNIMDSSYKRLPDWLTTQSEITCTLGLGVP